MTTIGYVWVGPLEYNRDYQAALLADNGVERLLEDIADRSGQGRDRLGEALDALAAGDTLVVWRLDRLGSTLSSVLTLLDLLVRRGVTVVSVADKFDSSAAGVRLTIASFVELDRRLHRERTMSGVYAARARGRVGGRPRALSEANVERVLAMRDQGATVREIAEEVGTSRATVYRAFEWADRDQSQDDDTQRRTITMRLRPGGADGDPGIASVPVAD
ncbi:MAG: recombinase family protein [Brevundimonas sp.]